MKLSYRGSLVIFLLENSAKLINTDFFKDMVTKLRVALPFFRIDWVGHNLDIIPHCRHRVWLRGMRRDAFTQDELPQPLPAHIFHKTHGKPSAMDFFNLDVPNTDPDTLGEKMSANYHFYMKQVRRMYAENPSLGSSCRLREYHSAITWDVIPALRTQGP